MLIQRLLPDEKAVLSVSREQLAGYILETLNAEAKGNYHGEDSYVQHQRNYISDIEKTFKSKDVADYFSFSWRWLIDQGYLAEAPAQAFPGWYRLTKKGRAVQRHDQIVTPRVPRDVNPGPPPDFRPLGGEPGLLKQLHVLWEEAVLCYGADAHLSTVVMLGSLLEGSLLAKAMANPEAVGRAAASPKDAGRVRPFDRWHLADLIQVASECGWIHAARTDFSDVLRDYRNLVHPFEAKDFYRIDRETAIICWQVVISTLRDLEVNIS